MKALDTNILARYLRDDDPLQSRRAAHFIQRAVRQSEPLYLNHVVLCELVWVLNSVYEHTKEEIVKTIEVVLLTGDFELEDKAAVEAALEDWKVPGTKLVATSAREVSGPKPVTHRQLRETALKEPLFLLFGTGWGLENSVVRKADYLLEPIRGRSPDGFRHLSVRSAVSIILDRLFGACY